MSDQHDKESILYAFALEPVHSREALERYLDTYPAFAEDLIELSYELRLNETLELITCVETPDSMAGRAWTEFVSCGSGTTPDTTVVDLFAKVKGQAFAALAQSLDMPRSILAALRDRLADPSTIPTHVIDALATSLAASVQSVREYLGLPMITSSSAHFKSDIKPAQQSRVSFEQLVRDTEMTDEHRLRLLEGDNNDGPNRG